MYVYETKVLNFDLQKEEMESMVRSGKEEMDSGSGSDQIEGGLSGNEQDTDPQQPPSKKKRYHRHTAHQIQEMEAYASISISISIYLGWVDNQNKKNKTQKHDIFFIFIKNKQASN